MRVTLILLCAGLAACSSANEAERALSGAGYTNVKITGYVFFGCGKDDSFHTGFEATGPSGKRVSGIVCSGLLKGATIRTD